MTSQTLTRSRSWHLLVVAVLTALATLSPLSTLRAQEGTELLSPFARGAGRTYSVTARGLDAMGLNPALIGLEAPRPFELQLAPFAAIGTNAGPTIVHINSISKGFQDTNLSSIAPASTSGTIGDSTREAIVDYLKGNGLSSTINTRIFGLAYHDRELGSFALSATLHVAIRANIPDSMLSYIGRSAEPNLAAQAILGPTKVDIQGLAYTEYQLSYSRNILGTLGSQDLQLRGGLSLNYYAGIEYMRVDPNSTFAFNDPRPNQGGSAVVAANYRIQFAYPSGFGSNGLPVGFSLDYLTAGSAGSGIGADVGFTMGVFDSTGYSPWQASFSVADIGSIKWTSNTKARYADTAVEASFSDNLDIVNSKVSALSGQIDSSQKSFTSKLPTTMHIGGAFDLSAIGLSMDGFRWQAAAEYALGLTDVVGSPNNGRFGMALIMSHPSAGFSLHGALGFTTQDGTSDATLAGGFGIGNVFEVDLGTARLFGLFKTNANKDGVMAIRFRF